MRGTYVLYMANQKAFVYISVYYQPYRACEHSTLQKASRFDGWVAPAMVFDATPSFDIAPSLSPPLCKEIKQYAKQVAPLRREMVIVAGRVQGGGIVAVCKEQHPRKNK